MAGGRKRILGGRGSESVGRDGGAASRQGRISLFIYRHHGTIKATWFTSPDNAFSFKSNARSTQYKTGTFSKSNRARFLL